jgi:hypothetical protein
MLVRTLLLIALATAPLGCGGPRYVVSVDGVTHPSLTSGRHFILYPGSPDVAPNDLYFQEFASYVKIALKGNGYIDSPPDSADLMILMRYGIGDPQVHTYTYSVPIIERTDPGTSTYTSYSYGSFGSFYTSGTISSKPRYGVVGSTTHTSSYTTYFRYLVLDAIDLNIFRQDSSVSFVWRTVLTSEGSSSDLRQIVAAMVTASEKLIGRNTERRIDITIRDNDPKIVRLRAAAQRQ